MEGIASVGRFQGFELSNALWPRGDLALPDVLARKNPLAERVLMCK